MPRSAARTACVAAVAIVVLLASSCGKSSSSNGTTQGSAAGKEAAAGPPVAGGRLSLAIAAETDSFNPYNGAWSPPSYAVANAVFDPLMAVDPDGAAKPYLAQTMTSDSTFTTWTITLRPGVMFHDGSPVDAAAVKGDLDAAKASALIGQAFTPITGIDAPDANTVVVHMKTPWSTFPFILTTQAGYIIAPKMRDDPAGANADLDGSGPFIYKSRQRDASLTTQRNPNYWQKDSDGQALPYLDGIEFKVITDPQSMKASLQAGDVNTLQAAAPGVISSMKASAEDGTVNLVSNEKTENDEAVLALNTSKPPFDDPIAREALAYAIDQDALSATTTDGQWPGAWGMFADDSPWAISREEAGYPQPDPEKAKSLAAQYQQDHGSPISFTMLAVPGPENVAILQAVQAQLADVGIKADVSALEATAIIDKVVVSGDYQASIFLLWSSPTPDQGYGFIATKANPDGLSLNYTRFDDPGLVAALDSFRSTTDVAKQKEDMATLQKEMATNRQMIFLFHSPTVFAYTKNVHGFNASTFPDSDVPAYSPYPTTPFYAHVWISS